MHRYYPKSPTSSSDEPKRIHHIHHVYSGKHSRKKFTIEIGKYIGDNMVDIILKDSTKAGPLIKKLRKDQGVTQEDIAGCCKTRASGA